jgi:hypothetical protein
MDLEHLIIENNPPQLPKKNIQLSNVDYELDENNKRVL